VSPSCSRGTRLSCYYLSVDVAGETEFKYREENGVSAFYWVDDGLAYAIAANAPRELLLKVADGLSAELAGRRQTQTPAAARQAQLGVAAFDGTRNCRGDFRSIIPRGIKSDFESRSHGGTLVPPHRDLKKRAGMAEADTLALVTSISTLEWSLFLARGSDPCIQREDKHMKRTTRHLTATAIIAIAISAATAVRADDGDSGSNRFVVTNLTSNLNGAAPNLDPVLQNAWGVTFTPGASPFWIADNATGCSTLYDGQGAIASTLQVKIPLPGGSVPSTACKPVTSNTSPTPAAPTGVVWNPTSTFLVPNQSTNTPAIFIFDTEDGIIAAWAGGLSPADQAVLAVDNSGSGAVYKGLVFGTNAKGVFLFATNFNAGTVDVFGPATASSNGMYVPVTTDGGFMDPDIPSGFAPFGIQNINGNLFVTYAKQNAAKHDDVAGAGNGFVDVFDTDGHLLRRFASQGPLNSPWGVARASFAFGRFSGDILVGNFGNGKIHAFDSNGRFLGTLRDVNGKPIVIDGLWTLTLGGGRNSNSDTLYFTAGPNDETNGLFGTITPVSNTDN
jgi:uncharacterized protein (TIGR03118 family)